MWKVRRRRRCPEVVGVTGGDAGGSVGRASSSKKNLQGGVSTVCRILSGTVIIIGAWPWWQLLSMRFGVVWGYSLCWSPLLTLKKSRYRGLNWRLTYCGWPTICFARYLRLSEPWRLTVILNIAQNQMSVLKFVVWFVNCNSAEAHWLQK